MTDENLTKAAPDNAVTITVEISFDPNKCEDVSAADYDPTVDLTDILEFGCEQYNVLDWRVIA